MHWEKFGGSCGRFSVSSIWCINCPTKHWMSTVFCPFNACFVKYNQTVVPSDSKSKWGLLTRKFYKVWIPFYLYRCLNSTSNNPMAFNSFTENFILTILVPIYIFFKKNKNASFIQNNLKNWVNKKHLKYFPLEKMSVFRKKGIK